MGVGDTDARRNPDGPSNDDAEPVDLRHDPARPSADAQDHDPAVAAVLDAATDRDSSERDAPEADAMTTRVPAGSPARDRPLITLGAAIGDGGSSIQPLDPDHPEFQAILRQNVLEEIRAHADLHPSIEVCGVMVGTVYETPQASFVYVDAMIRGEASSGRSTQVTFTAETWQHIHRVMEAEHAGKRIIGWYHTHPGFGIFLSEMDLFIQRHFFNAAWQMAFVYDPTAVEAGMFAWRQAQVRRIDFVIDDEAAPRANEAPSESATRRAAAAGLSAPAHFTEHTAAPVEGATVQELVDRVRALEGRLKWLQVAFAILALVAIIWPLVAMVVAPPRSPGELKPGGELPAADRPAGTSDQRRPPLLPMNSK